MGWRTEECGFDSKQGQEIALSSITFRPGLGLTEPLIREVPAVVSPWVKRQVTEADHSPPSSAEARNGGAVPPLPYTSL
jgi:hypothetical protein